MTLFLPNKKCGNKDVKEKNAHGREDAESAKDRHALEHETLSFEGDR